MRALAVAAFVLAVAPLACAGDPPPPPSPRDAGPLCTDDPAEVCTPCFEHLGACCYDDPTIMGHVPALVASCESEPTCRRCCSECVAMTCDELMASRTCPNVAP